MSSSKHADRAIVADDCAFIFAVPPYMHEILLYSINLRAITPAIDTSNGRIAAADSRACSVSVEAWRMPCCSVKMTSTLYVLLVSLARSNSPTQPTMTIVVHFRYRL